MTPKRVIFLSDSDDAPAIDRDLLEQYREVIERKILRDGTDDAETVSLPGALGVGFLTNLPRPKIGRVMARWILINDEDALVTGIRSGGQSFEVPEDDI